MTVIITSIIFDENLTELEKSSIRKIHDVIKKVLETVEYDDTPPSFTIQRIKDWWFFGLQHPEGPVMNINMFDVLRYELKKIGVTIDGLSPGKDRSNELGFYMSDSLSRFT